MYLVYARFSFSLWALQSSVLNDCCSPKDIVTLITDEAISSGNIFADWRFPNSKNVGTQLSLLHYFSSGSAILSDFLPDVHEPGESSAEAQAHETTDANTRVKQVTHLPDPVPKTHKPSVT